MGMLTSSICQMLNAPFHKCDEHFCTTWTLSRCPSMHIVDLRCYAELKIDWPPDIGQCKGAFGDVFLTPCMRETAVDDSHRN